VSVATGPDGTAAPARWVTPPFVSGVNLPWLSYGNDFGANAWHPAGGVATPEVRARLRDALAAIADRGDALVRWFFFCDGRSGFRADSDGRFAGVDERIWPDVEAALEEVALARLRVMPVIFDFSWFHPASVVAGVQVGGRAGWLTDEAQRARLRDSLLAPLFTRCASSQAVAAWDIVNEPEWIAGTTPWHRWRHRRAGAAISRLVAETAALIHGISEHAATVGLASWAGLPLVRNAGLDVYQAHWYDESEMRAPLGAPVAGMGLDRPILLGEFPTRGSRRTRTEIVDAARNAGYVGALEWSALATDAASDPMALGRRACGRP
jgi:hypothetical protein